MFIIVMICGGSTIQK